MLATVDHVENSCLQSSTSDASGIRWITIEIYDLGYDLAELAALMQSGALKTPQPWRLAKEPDEDTRDQLDAVLYTLAESLTHHRDFDFAGVAESGAWNFRSTQLEDGIERKRGTVFTRGRGVGEIAGRTCRG